MQNIKNVKNLFLNKHFEPAVCKFPDFRVEGFFIGIIISLVYETPIISMIIGTIIYLTVVSIGYTPKKSTILS